VPAPEPVAADRLDLAVIDHLEPPLPSTPRSKLSRYQPDSLAVGGVKVGAGRDGEAGFFRVAGSDRACCGRRVAGVGPPRSPADDCTPLEPACAPSVVIDAPPLNPSTATARSTPGSDASGRGSRLTL